MPETPTVSTHETEMVKLADLHPHERNYRAHPADQVEHLAQSIREHGFYRNVVIARDNTILAGHGVVEAAAQIGLEEIPVVRLDIDPEDPKALKVLAGDNELARLAEIDDRMLSELLKEIQEVDLTGLLGTGYDEMMLANLVFVTRPAGEVRTMDEAAQWVGMPEFEGGAADILLILHFDDEAGRAALINELSLIIMKKMRQAWSAWYPPRPRQDLASLLFDG